MDYIDRVYVDLKDREPGNYLMSSLKDPEKFIAAVKYLIDGGWIINVHWDTSYTTLFIEQKTLVVGPANKTPGKAKTDWYSSGKPPA